MSQGLVRLCPQGYFREQYLDFDAPLAQTCTPCQQGINTNGPGATSAQQCNTVLPGYGLANLQANRTGAASLPVLPSSSPSGLPAASMCPLGYYSDGGYCMGCPGGSVTTRPGAEAVEECGEYTT
jgi:hypothetical protein